MGVENLLPAFAAVVVTAFAWLVLHRRQISSIEVRLAQERAATQDAERTLHLKEMDFLRQRNERESEFADLLAGEREKLAQQRTELLQRLEVEKTEAAAAARDKLRAEYELQNKLFSVTISPYVQLVTDKGFFTDDFQARIGYQYQLLVNGIPAFQPHVVIERHEKVKQFDEKIKAAFLEIATSTAKLAIQTYLGANGQFAALGAEVVKQVEE